MQLNRQIKITFYQAIVLLMVILASGMSLGGESSLKTTTLYRSVNHEELKQLRQAKQFAQGPNSLEGKFFAENYADAEKWGNALNGVGNHVVIEVEVPISAADKMMRWNRLDGIGPARYGTLDQLKNININIPSLSNDLFKP